MSEHGPTPEVESIDDGSAGEQTKGAIRISVVAALGGFPVRLRQRRDQRRRRGHRAAVPGRTSVVGLRRGVRLAGRRRGRDDGRPGGRPVRTPVRHEAGGRALLRERVRRRPFSERRDAGGFPRHRRPGRRVRVRHRAGLHRRGGARAHSRTPRIAATTRDRDRHLHVADRGLHPGDGRRKLPRRAVARHGGLALDVHRHVHPGGDLRRAGHDDSRVPALPRRCRAPRRGPEGAVDAAAPVQGRGDDRAHRGEPEARHEAPRTRTCAARPSACCRSCGWVFCCRSSSSSSGST